MLNVTEKKFKPEIEAAPNVVYRRPADAKQVEFVGEKLAATMNHLGIPESATKQRTVYVDSRSKLVTNGTMYPASLSSLRYWHHPFLRKVDGPVVRINTVKRGRPRSEQRLNRTLVHELEHLAQEERKDWRLALGRLSIAGFTVAGAVVGSKIGSSTREKAAFGLMGAGVGNQIGYKVAPHERQARAAAKAYQSTAIKIHS